MAPISQPVVVPPSEAAVVLVLTLREGDDQPVLEAIADLTGVIRAVAFRYPDAQTTCVAGIGSAAWDRLFPGKPKPNGLHPFIELDGGTHAAPSTPGDLVLHVRGKRFDLCFELADKLLERLDGLVDVADRLQGFRYFDERDLLGFVDGTESPSGDEALQTVTITDDPPFDGGSYLITQRYLHDLTAWNGLTVEQQEAAIGRHKLDDIEIPDAKKAANSHVVLNSITDTDGNDLKIVRENMPFGTVGEEYGTYFIGYASDPAVIERMLHNMFIGDPVGTHDRILDFSTAVTGSLFYIPTVDFLDDPKLA